MTIFRQLSQLENKSELKNLALTVSSELYAQYRDAYITGYALTISVIVLLCLLAALVIFRGIRRTLIYDPEYSPLEDESLKKSGLMWLEFQMKRIW